MHKKHKDVLTLLKLAAFYYSCCYSEEELCTLGCSNTKITCIYIKFKHTKVNINLDCIYIFPLNDNNKKKNPILVPVQRSEHRNKNLIVFSFCVWGFIKGVFRPEF